MKRVKTIHWSKLGKRSKKKRKRISATLDLDLIACLKRAKRENADISQIVEEAINAYFLEHPI